VLCDIFSDTRQKESFIQNILRTVIQHQRDIKTSLIYQCAHCNFPPELCDIQYSSHQNTTIINGLLDSKTNDVSKPTSCHVRF